MSYASGFRGTTAFSRTLLTKFPQHATATRKDCDAMVTEFLAWLNLDSGVGRLQASRCYSNPKDVAILDKEQFRSVLRVCPTWAANHISHFLHLFPQAALSGGPTKVSASVLLVRRTLYDTYGLPRDWLVVHTYHHSGDSALLYQSEWEFPGFREESVSARDAEVRHGVTFGGPLALPPTV